MNIGFLGLGKLGLPCALAIEKFGRHSVVGYDPSEKVKEIIKDKKIPYREEGAQELLDNSNIKILPIKDVAGRSDIIFIAVQTPHAEKYEGITRLPDERKDFDYSYLKESVIQLSEELNKIKRHKIVVIISTVLPGTIEREIRPFMSPYIDLCYNPFFIAMGTTIPDFMNPEFVLLGTDSFAAKETVKLFYKTLHDRPVFETTIENAELIKVVYNTAISTKIVMMNTVMEICHKTPNTNVDEVTRALSLATDRIISNKYMRGGMGDGGGCVLYDSKIKVNNEIFTIGDFYEIFHSSENKKFFIESINSDCSEKEEKLIKDVTKRKYKGKLYKFSVQDEEFICTEDHLIPVFRNGKMEIIRADKVKQTDKLYYDNRN